ncbi:MAG: phosphomethylpyrimidine synthase ThiC, partial [Thermovirga sp.]|nr:phosphomethylpyrimidine synthase ThiC [Thermovirga sp.]
MSKTQLESAKAGIITEEMKAAAIGEPLSAEQIRNFVAKGWVVIPKNKNRSFPQVKAIGKGLRTKVNANLGTSDEKADLEFERRKLESAIKAGADSVMDLSTGGDLNEAREFFLENSPVMVGTVPIYHVASEMAKKGKRIEDMTEEMLFESIERQCQQGVDYITVHCGVNFETAARLKYANRIMPCVSRGGSITLRWMKKNKK